jgi:hypothetical protein
MNRRTLISAMLAAVSAGCSGLDILRITRVRQRPGRCQGWWYDADDAHAPVCDRELYDALEAAYVACTKETELPDFIYCDEHVYQVLREMALKDCAYL